MNGHFSGGKCSRRREAARYIYAEYTPCRRDYYCVRADDDGEDGKSIQYLKTYNIYISNRSSTYYILLLYGAAAAVSRTLRRSENARRKEYYVQ